MFEQSCLEYAEDRRGVAALFSFGIQLCALSLLVILPTLYTHPVPKSFLRTLFIPTAPLPAAPTPHMSETTTGHTGAHAEVAAFTVHSVHRIPNTFSRDTDNPTPPSIGDISQTGTVSDFTAGAPGIFRSIGTALPPRVATAPHHAITVSTGVMQGHLVRQVQPAYPPLARSAHIQGAVVLGAVISREGSVEGLHLESGHPMLAKAAMDAVRQRRYRPYLLNGLPVQVETQITVIFSLHDN